MIRKISGKNKSPSYTHLNMVGTDSKATSKTDIADTLGETFCHNSSSFNYSESFRKIKTEQEKFKLNFKSQNNEIYNKDFNLDELVEAIQLSHPPSSLTTLPWFGGLLARGTLFLNNCPLCLKLKVSQALALWRPRNMDGCPAPLGTDCMYLRT